MGSPIPWFTINGLSQPGFSGDMIATTCQWLDPKPNACSMPSLGLAGTTLSPPAALAAQAAQHKKCENCYEIGAFRWRSSGGTSRPTARGWNAVRLVGYVGSL